MESFWKDEINLTYFADREFEREGLWKALELVTARVTGLIFFSIKLGALSLAGNFFICFKIEALRSIKN